MTVDSDRCRGSIADGAQGARDEIAIDIAVDYQRGVLALEGRR